MAALDDIISEAVIIAWYVRASKGLIDNLILLPRVPDFRLSLGAQNIYHRLYPEYLERITAPDVCFCGKIFSTDGFNLRLYCPACAHKWKDNCWSVQHQITVAKRAIRTFISCDDYLVNIILAKAILLESQRKALNHGHLCCHSNQDSANA